MFVNRHNEVLVHTDPLAKQPKCASEVFPPCLHRGNIFFTGWIVGIRVRWAGEGGGGDGN